MLHACVIMEENKFQTKQRNVNATNACPQHSTGQKVTYN